MEAVYTIEGNINKDDQIAFQYLSVYFKKPIGLIVYAITSALGAFIFGKNILGDNYLYYVFFGLGIFGFLIFLTYARVRLKVVRKMVKDISGRYDQFFTFRFFGHGISLEGKRMSKNKVVKYEYIYRVIESRKYFIIYFNEHEGIPLRKSEVSKLAEFRAFLKDKVGKKYISAPF